MNKPITKKEWMEYLEKTWDAAQEEVLAQPEQEPEWYHGVDKHGCNRFYHKTEVRPSEFKTPLYTTPPQRTWVGLSYEDIDIAFDDTQEGGGFDDFARAIEAKLKQKNGYAEEKNT